MPQEIALRLADCSAGRERRFNRDLSNRRVAPSHRPFLSYCLSLHASRDPEIGTICSDTETPAPSFVLSPRCVIAIITKPTRSTKPTSSVTGGNRFFAISILIVASYTCREHTRQLRLGVDIVRWTLRSNVLRKMRSKEKKRKNEKHWASVRFCEEKEKRRRVISVASSRARRTKRAGPGVLLLSETVGRSSVQTPGLAIIRCRSFEGAAIRVRDIPVSEEQTGLVGNWALPRRTFETSGR